MQEFAWIFMKPISCYTGNGRLVDELVARTVENLNLNAAGSVTDAI